VLNEADLLHGDTLSMLNDLEVACNGRYADLSYELRYMVEDAFDEYLEAPSIATYEELEVAVDICRDEVERIIDEDEWI
jgi:hypothetical protein